MKKLLIVGAGILLGFQAAAAFAQMPPPPPPRSITVTGEGKKDVSPDQAILSMSLVSKDKDLNAAKKHNDALVDRVVVITKQFNVAKEKIATSGVYIAPEYSYQNNGGQPLMVGYTVNRSLRITIDDLSVQERLLSAIVDAKIDQVNGLEFQLSDPEKIASELRVKAFENAKSKAESLAKAAGAKLGPALTIMTGDMPMSFPPRPVPMMAAMESRAGAPDAAPVLPGQINIQQSITVTFALE